MIISNNLSFSQILELDTIKEQYKYISMNLGFIEQLCPIIMLHRLLYI